jgi:hypothetical protein
MSKTKINAQTLENHLDNVKPHQQYRCQKENEVPNFYQKSTAKLQIIILERTTQ